jgi:hypothetical protein
MSYRLSFGVCGLAVGIGLGAISAAPAQIIDMSKYPAFSGGWARGEMYQWSRGERPPLTAQYQAVYQANLAERATGGQGSDTMYRCFPPGMPRQMHVYAPMQIVITPATTYILIDHIHDNRRIYTDGRDWPDPEEDVERLYSGHSIGRWIDEDGDGKYDTLEVETRYIKGPRTLDGILPTDEDDQTIVKERIFLDKANADVLHDEITLYDHAYTRPWTILRTYPRYMKGKTIWWPEEVCAEAQVHVSVGKQDYFISSDGYLMPVKKDQPPPDLRYFKVNGK